MQIRNKDLETFVTLNNIIMLIAVILQKSHEIAGKGCFVPCPISFNIAPPTECENIDFFDDGIYVVLFAEQSVAPSDLGNPVIYAATRDGFLEQNYS